MGNNNVIKVPIGKIQLGEIDGKYEARNPIFEDLFYDEDEYYKELKDNQSKFLVIGRKGTGKTILIQYFKKKINKEKNKYCKIITSNTFEEEKLNNFNYSSVRPEEMETFWKFVLLKELSEVVLDEEGSYFSKKWLAKLQEANESISVVLSELITEDEENNSATIGMANKNMTVGLSGSYTNKSQKKYNTTQYFSKVKLLKNTLLDVLKRTKKNYYLIFDDLDEIKDIVDSPDDDNNQFTSLMKSLITAMEKLNDEFYEMGKNTRVIATLRKDVIDEIQKYGSNISKPITVGSINIDWFSPLIINHPELTKIGKLIAHKARVSVEEYKNIPEPEIFNMLFPKNSTGNSFSYLFKRSFGRPRDIIAYLKICQKNKKDMNAESFNFKDLKDSLGEYSDWFYHELENEINILDNRDSINDTLLLIKKNEQTSFFFDDLNAFYEDNSEEFKNIVKLKSDIEVLFKLGVLGNSNKVKKRVTAEFNYRNGINNANFDTKFTTHLAVRRYLMNL